MLRTVDLDACASPALPPSLSFGPNQDNWRQRCIQLQQRVDHSNEQVTHWATNAREMTSTMRGLVDKNLSLHNENQDLRLQVNELKAKLVELKAEFLKQQQLATSLRQQREKSNLLSSGFISPYAVATLPFDISPQVESVSTSTRSQLQENIILEIKNEKEDNYHHLHHQQQQSTLKNGLDSAIVTTTSQSQSIAQRPPPPPPPSSSTAAATTKATNLKKKFQCPMCPLKYCLKTSLYHHQKLKHFPISTKKAVRNSSRSKTKTEINNDEDDEEEKVSVTDSASTSVCDGVYPLRLKCSYCPSIFTAPYSLRRHERKHTGCLDFACDLCSKIYYTNYSLQQHKKKVHGVKYTRLYKPRTKLSKSQRNALLKRQKARHPTCSVCHKIFLKLSLLKKHELTAHKETNTRNYPFECRVCSQKFTKKVSLFHHMNSHKGD